MFNRFAFAALAMAVTTALVAPKALYAQTTESDTAAPDPLIRPLEAVIVTAERRSAFETAMSRLGARAGIAARQRENRRLARRLAAYDRVAFGLERKLDSLMVVATIQELTIARTDSATAMIRSRRLHLEAMLCQASPSECANNAGMASGTKGH